MKRLALALTLCLASGLLHSSHAQDSNQTTLSPDICKLKGDERIVPNILGFEPAKAQATVEACDFVWDGATDVHTMSYEEIGRVGDQEPSGGTVAKAKSTVRGFISNGMFAPDFTGWTASDAERYIRDLRHGVLPKYLRNSAPVGIVFDQEPKNAVKYNSGLAVTIYVSLGLYVDVPDLKDLEYGVAVNTLKGLNLVPVHAGGDFDYGSKQITVCELQIWYPVIESFEPKGRLYEGDQVRLVTRRFSEFQFGRPDPNTKCP